MKLLYFSSHLCFCMQTHTRYLLFISFLCLCHLVSIQEPFSTQLSRVFWEIITDFTVNWFVVVLQNKLTDWQAWNRSQIFIYYLPLFSENVNILHLHYTQWLFLLLFYLQLFCDSYICVYVEAQRCISLHDRALHHAMFVILIIFDLLSTTESKTMCSASNHNILDLRKRQKTLQCRFWDCESGSDNAERQSSAKTSSKYV